MKKWPVRKVSKFFRGGGNLVDEYGKNKKETLPGDLVGDPVTSQKLKKNKTGITEENDRFIEPTWML